VAAENRGATVQSGPPERRRFRAQGCDGRFQYIERFSLNLPEKSISLSDELI